MSEICKIFADNLRRLRKERGLTQEQLAEEVDLSPTSIQGYEAQRTWPHIEAISDIAKVLKVPDYKLFEKAPPERIETLAQIILDQANELKRFESIQTELLEALSKAPPRKVEMVRAALGLPVLISARRQEKKA